MGVKGVYGASPFWYLSDRKCPDCDGQHPLDLASCVAFCSASSSHRARMVDSWGPNVAPQVQRWIQGLRTKGELRNFARTLIPVALYDALTVDSNGKRHLHDALAPGRKVLTSVLGGSSCMVKMRPKLPLHGTAKNSPFGGDLKHKKQKSCEKQITGPFSFIFNKTDCPGK